MKYELKIEEAFTDKKTGAFYSVGDVIEVGKTRGEELLADPRNLVSLAREIREKETQPKLKGADA